jgi:DNA replication protein DnaC
MTTFSIEIDNNHPKTITRLIYYILTNNLLTEENKSFVLDDRILLSGKMMNFILPKEGVRIPFDGQDVYMMYKKTRESANYCTMEIRFDQIILHSEYNLEHLVRFLDMIGEIEIPESCEDELARYIWSDNNWKYNKTFKKRKLETIYFPRKQEIVDTLDQFLNDKDRYNFYKELDIPYKYIFMFHGLPGTGKTSLIQALASHFNYNISVVKNVAEVDDNALEQMLNTLRNRTFLVFEDIDSIVQHRSTSSRSRMSYSGLLNMLDGIANYDKLVIFITTNKLENLETAFKRRIDMFVEFGHIQKTELVLMYEKFFKNSTDALEFYQSVRYKKLTVNMLEKYFMYCLQKNIHPSSELSFLEHYNSMTSEKFLETMYS